MILVFDNYFFNKLDSGYKKQTCANNTIKSRGAESCSGLTLFEQFGKKGSYLLSVSVGNPQSFCKVFIFRKAVMYLCFAINDEK